jgi:hypothetical protein
MATLLPTAYRNPLFKSHPHRAERSAVIDITSALHAPFHSIACRLHRLDDQFMTENHVM